MRRWLALLLPCGLAAQMSVSASVTGAVASSEGWRVRDREVYGVRYRTPSLGRLTAQVGVVATAENGIVFPSDGEGMRHWAAAAEYRVARGVRVSGIFGNIVEIRDASLTRPGVPPIAYYQLTAAGVEWSGPRGLARVERLLSTPAIKTTALHKWVVQVRSPYVDVLGQWIASGPGQAVYRFPVAAVTVRPWARRSVPWKYVGGEWGSRTLLSYTENRHILLRYAAVGVYVGMREQ